MDLAYEALGTARSAPSVGAKLPLLAGVMQRLRALLRADARRFLLPLAAVSAISMAGTVAAPVLTDAPLLLVALSPRIPFLALAAGDSELLPFLAVAVPRLLLTDPIYFRLGRKHGAAALAVLPGTRGRLARVAALSAPVLVLLRPVGRHLALAGAGRSQAWLVGVADIASTVAYLVAVHAAGAALG